MTKKRVYAAKGGYATKDDVINSLDCALNALAENRKNEAGYLTYRFSVYIRESSLNNSKNIKGEKE